MAGVGHKTDMNFSIVAELNIKIMPQMILDIAAAAVDMRLIGIGKVSKGLRRRFAERVGKYIEPTAVRHAEHNLLHAVVARDV